MTETSGLFRWVRLSAVLVAVAALVVVALVAVNGLRGEPREHLTAEFATANGIYVGSDVRVVGVVVGTVESISPAGDVVRIGMSLDPGTRVPAEASALIITPSPIADRSIELSPAYTEGEALADGDAIPVERTRAPLELDEFARNLSTLGDAISPRADTLGSAVGKGADVLEDKGPELNRSLRDLSTVSHVTADRTPDMQAIVDDLSRLLTAVGGTDGSLQALIDQLDTLGATVTDNDVDVGAATADLTQVLKDVDSLLSSSGDDISASAKASLVTTQMVSQHQVDLAEIVDLYPMLMANLPKTIGSDGRSRIRLDISSDLAAFTRGQDFCQRERIPLCAGAGITNPISFPISSNPMNLVDQLGGALQNGSTR